MAEGSLQRVPFLIVGGGPAGLAAAETLSARGENFLLLDEHPSPGGQLWRGEDRACPQFQGGVQIISIDSRLHRLSTSLGDFQYGKLLLATGARELFLPFPGWTLPHVLGAGGIQVLAKQGLDLRGKRIVVAGSGPLLLAVASKLESLGAIVPVIAEQAPWHRLFAFASNLIGYPSKLLEAVEYFSFRYRADLWPLSTRPGEVSLSNGATIPCDYLACAFGLVPNTELAQLAGCHRSDGFVTVDALQRTSINDIYAAGEITGIGGLDKAWAEGRAAASGEPLDRDYSHFVELLRDTFTLREELRVLAPPDCIVCRCEDVRLAQLDGCANFREAKLYERCGMGPCQGRVCGPALQWLKGWDPDHARPPLTPGPLNSLL